MSIHQVTTYYDSDQRTILEDEVLKNNWGVPERFFVGNAGNIWIYNGKKWNVLGNHTYDQQNFDFLNIFPDMRQLFYSEKNQHFWLVTANNKIYEIESHKEESLVSKHNIYLREIRKQNNILLPDPKLDVELQGSALTFSFIQPDYSGLMGIEYQYKLAGLMDSWSNWDSQNNIFTFSYLPAGLYQLEFKTKNIFGNEKSIIPIEFKVIAPYWRRPWFYAMEVAFFSVLLILSIRLNRANTRYRVVSKLLAFLTLILIVEFVQTVVEYKFETDSSPVIDFFIQVSIALLVLPVESVLRKALFSKNNAELLKAAKEVTTSLKA